MKQSMVNQSKRLSILASAVVLCLGAIGGAVAVGQSQESAEAGGSSFAVFKRDQRASERGLIPSNPRIPGVATLGTDPSLARSVDTGENGPDVIAIPGRTGACLAVLFDNGAGGTGASYACDTYANIAKGRLLATLESGSRTEYIGLLPDGHQKVNALIDGREVSHRVVDNVYSFAHAGSRNELVAVGADGSRKALGQP